eukprot:PhF_6_TR32383/c0_g1_i1/m.48028/K01365/CTSL; cathepsin L
MSIFVSFVVAACFWELSQAARIKANALNHSYVFEQYLKEFGKQYSPEEYNLRKSLFEKRRNEAILHNQGKASWKRGVNHFSDWTESELKATLGYKASVGHARRAQKSFAEVPPFKGGPGTVDWRKVPGVLSAIKDQGRCGSCWTFASSETIESRWAVSTGLMSDVSAQQIASCTSNPQDCGGSGGCEGGIAEVAFESVINNGGIASEWTYPYVSYDGTDYPCKYGPTNKTTTPVVKLQSYVALPTNSYDALMTAIQDGPVAITVDASVWHSYESGIFDGCNQTSPVLNHNVQLVGYGEENNVPYWIVRNSWSPYFGEGGFIRLVRDFPPRCGIDTNPSAGSGCNNGPPNVTVCGTCGILYDNSYPVIAP